MTKVQRHFQLQRPVDEALMEEIAQIHAIYGIERVRVEPSGSLLIEYDASRLTLAGVELALERAGIPVTGTVSA